MAHCGTNVRPQPGGVMGVYAVSNVCLDKDSRFTGMPWGRVDTQANKWATHEVVGRPSRAAAGKQYVRR